MVFKKLNENSDYVMINMSTAKQNTISMGSAVNSKLVGFFNVWKIIIRIYGKFLNWKKKSNFSEPVINNGFSADSGCEDMNTR